MDVICRQLLEHLPYESAEASVVPTNTAFSCDCNDRLGSSRGALGLELVQKLVDRLL